MNPFVVIWILSACVSLFVGFEVVKWALGANKKLEAKKRSAQALAAKLRDAGLKLIPQLLDDFVIGDWQDAADRIHEFARLVEVGGDAAITKELDGTFSNMLDAKLATPEGLALIQAKIACAPGSPGSGRRARSRPGEVLSEPRQG